MKNSMCKCNEGQLIYIFNCETWKIYSQQPPICPYTTYIEDFLYFIHSNLFADFTSTKYTNSAYHCFDNPFKFLTHSTFVLNMLSFDFWIPIRINDYYRFMPNSLPTGITMADPYLKSLGCIQFSQILLL